MAMPDPLPIAPVECFDPASPGVQVDTNGYTMEDARRVDLSLNRGVYKTSSGKIVTIASQTQSDGSLRTLIRIDFEITVDSETKVGSAYMVVVRPQGATIAQVVTNGVGPLITLAAGIGTFVDSTTAVVDASYADLLGRILDGEP